MLAGEFYVLGHDTRSSFHWGNNTLLKISYLVLSFIVLLKSLLYSFFDSNGCLMWLIECRCSMSLSALALSVRAMSFPV